MEKAFLNKWYKNLNYILKSEGQSYQTKNKERHVKGVLSSLIDEVKLERDKYWVEHLQAHRKHCTSQGNKELTKVKKLLTLKHL